MNVNLKSFCFDKDALKVFRKNRKDLRHLSDDELHQIFRYEKALDSYRRFISSEKSPLTLLYRGVTYYRYDFAFDGASVHRLAYDKFLELKDYLVPIFGVKLFTRTAICIDEGLLSPEDAILYMMFYSGNIFNNNNNLFNP